MLPASGEGISLWWDIWSSTSFKYIYIERLSHVENCDHGDSNILSYLLKVTLAKTFKK